MTSNSLARGTKRKVRYRLELSGKRHKVKSLGYPFGVPTSTFGEVKKNSCLSEVNKNRATMCTIKLE